MINSIFFKSFIFLLFPFIFYFLDFINYVRAGKIALVGFFAIYSLLSWKTLYPNNKILKYILIFSIFSIFLNLSFHGALRDIFGISQDDILVIQTIVSTDTQEITEFLIQYEWLLVKHFSIFLCSFLVYTTYVLKTFTVVMSKKVAIMATILLGIIHLNTSIARSNPFVYFPYYYTKWQIGVEASRKLSQEIDNNIKSSEITTMHYVGKNLRRTVVWVIGESDTKYNWSLYGYERETNPMLASIRNELLVFKNISAAAPATISAFEKMLTSATINEPNKWIKDPDILLMAKNAGYKIYWISNHSTDKYGVLSIFASHANQVLITNQGTSRGEGSYDETVIRPYKEALDEDYEKKLIIVHLLGSHPAYNFRYPDSFDKFTNIFNDKVYLNLKNKGRADWALLFRNLYDNSVLYSDNIRYQLIDILRYSREANNSVLLYHPDHGQDVCHNSNFSGHNHKAKEQWDVPFFLWGNEVLNYDKNSTEIKYSLDNIDHTILGLLQIAGHYYNEAFDIFNFPK